MWGLERQHPSSCTRLSSADSNSWLLLYTQFTMPSWAPSVFTWTLMWDQHCDQMTTLPCSEGSPGDLNGWLIWCLHSLLCLLVHHSVTTLCYSWGGNTKTRQPPFQLPKALLVILMADLWCWHSLLCHLVDPFLPPSVTLEREHCGQTTTLLPAQGSPGDLNGWLMMLT